MAFVGLFFFHFLFSSISGPHPNKFHSRSSKFAICFEIENWRLCEGKLSFSAREECIGNSYRRCVRIIRWHRCHHKKAINSHLSSWPVFLEICLTSLKSLKYFWRVLRWLRNIVFFSESLVWKSLVQQMSNLIRIGIMWHSKILNLSKPFGTIVMILKARSQMQLGSFTFSNSSN